MPNSPEKSPSIDAINAEKEKTQSISSSSDSDSNEEDFFQLESTDLVAPSTKPPKTPTLADNGAKTLIRKPPAPSRYDVPDPNRIPMSIFARNTATTSPKDWSVASNESLFSIQLGNSSFSREHGMLLMGRSEDLGNLVSGTLEYEPARVSSGKFMKEEKEKEKGISYAIVDGISRQSDCSSTTSFGSFAFPILASEGKSESIKVMSMQYSEHQLHPFINSLNAPTTSLTTPPSASAKRNCFSCFSWCQFCC